MVKSRYSGEQLLVLDLNFTRIYPSNISMDDKNTLEKLAKNYYDQLVGPNNSRIPIKECESNRLFRVVKKLREEAEIRLNLY